jgi:hypothetical protein
MVYQMPTTKIRPGRCLEDAKTPRLNKSCHSPGSIHAFWGATGTSTAVKTIPTKIGGRNCPAARRSILLARAECSRRARCNASEVVSATETAAVRIQDSK